MLPCRIMQLRRSCGMNQQQLAEKLHLSPSTIGMYEQGRRTPNLDVLIQMSILFNVSLDYLITGSEFVPFTKDSGVSAPVDAPLCRNCCCQKLLDLIQEIVSTNEYEQKQTIL